MSPGERHHQAIPRPRQRHERQTLLLVSAQERSERHVHSPNIQLRAQMLWEQGAKLLRSINALKAISSTCPRKSYPSRRLAMIHPQKSTLFPKKTWAIFAGCLQHTIPGMVHIKCTSTLCHGPPPLDPGASREEKKASGPDGPLYTIFWQDRARQGKRHRKCTCQICPRTYHRPPALFLLPTRDVTGPKPPFPAF